ncbi:Lipid A export ATP-binding/permease protein MsbA [Clostridiaceae bacterium JG1575]|nr:Lipid A export ATP-binding/permease protein MsbA [Clostridiaceae bacterium JG1575]
MNAILTLLPRYKKQLIAPSLVLLLTIVLDSANPFLNRMIIDDAIPQRNLSLLLKILFGLLAITAGRALFGFYKEYTFDRIGVLLYRDLKDQLFTHLQSLHFQYFDNISTGELMSRLGEDLENIWRSVSFGFRLLVEQALYFLIGLTVLSLINLPLTLIILAVMSPIAYIALRFEKKIDQNFGEISDLTAELHTTAQENIAGVRLVKAFARERFEIRKFMSKNQRNYELNNEQATIIAHHFPLIELFTNLAVLVMIALGAGFVARGRMTLGSLAVFTGFIWNLIWPLRELGWLMNTAAQFNASAKKIQAIFDISPQVADAPGLSHHSLSGDVAFEHVYFSYEADSVLNDVSFRAHPGDTVAIMGATGAGKTSLIGLIGRYYTHAKGRILVDGCLTEEIPLDDLRGAMSIVPQDTFLFSESIRNNLTFSRHEASDEELAHALSIACADFVFDLEDGLDTVVGERGVGLSGGQKQRLAIARAILREAPMLILDDATSSLDMETEYQLLKNLKSIQHQRTTFIIAHRISAVKNATTILFMEHGTIVEAGTHEELVALKGKYYEIFREQFHDFDALQEVI